MAKKQLRFQGSSLDARKAQWLGRRVSVVLRSGVVHEVTAREVVAGVLHGSDGLRQKHSFPFADINELILYYPVAEHAQTSAD